MKFSVSSNQDKETINQADELFLREKDQNSFLDLIEQYPTKDYVIEISTMTPDSYFAQLKACSKIIKGNIYCCLSDIYLYEICKKYELKYFYKYPIQSFFELNGLKELGVSYVRLGMPLFFDMDNVQQFNIPIRITPNRAYEKYIPHKSGIMGQWIRPEDLNLYESYAAICEFRIYNIPLEEDNPLIYERTLLDIYKNKKKWNGSLNDIVKDLGIKTINSGAYDNLGQRRLNCKHSCQLGRCHFCESALKFGDTVKLYGEHKKIPAQINETIEQNSSAIFNIDNVISSQEIKKETENGFKILKTKTVKD